MSRSLRPVLVVAGVWSVAVACASLSGLSGGGPEDGGMATDAAAGSDSPTTDSTPGDAYAAPDVVEAGQQDACTADLAFDPHNCGACGHDCLGGTCNTGACQPVLFLTPDTSVGSANEGIAFDSSGLYWADFGPPPVVTHQGVVIEALDGGNPAGVLVRGGQLYFTDYSNGILYRSGLDGGAATAIATGLGNPGCFDMDSAGNVYVSDYIAGNINLVAANGVVTKIVSGLVNPWGIAVTPQALYWSEIGSNEVVRADLSGKLNLVISGLDPAACLAVDADNLYWSDTPTDGGGGVFRWPLDGGAVTTMTSAAGTNLGIAIDTVSIYYATGNGSPIWRLAK